VIKRCISACIARCDVWSPRYHFREETGAARSGTTRRGT